ncbi:MAG: hypothetical protein ACW986_06440 [Promethearchaeota archaeon]|jgi:hypothetical protein
MKGIISIIIPTGFNRINSNVLNSISNGSIKKAITKKYIKTTVPNTMKKISALITHKNATKSNKKNMESWIFMREMSYENLLDNLFKIIVTIKIIE